MMDNIFSIDVRIAEIELKKVKSRNFWLRLFTLGLFGVESEVIKAAEEKLNKYKQDLSKYEELDRKERELDRQIEEPFEIQGVRVDKNIFSDFSRIGANGYPENWEELRGEILTRDNFGCQEFDGYCEGPLQIHHRVFLLQGGSNNPSNLITLCRYHHSLHHPHMRN